MNETPEFPTMRFAEAGATEGEIEQLQGEFDRSDLSLQTSLTTTWRGQSSGDLRAELDEMRAADHFTAADGAAGADAHEGDSDASGGFQGTSPSKDSGERDPEGSTDLTE
jgi:hypothetical protein